MATATLSLPARSAAFDAALEGLTRLNERILSAVPLPPLYSSGVRYRTEPREMWRHAADVLREGWGDCEDLSAWRAAELRLSGEDPGASVATYKSGPRRYHAVVLRGDGTTEDPSRALGMRPLRQRGRRHMYETVDGDDDIGIGEDLEGIEGVAYCPGLCGAVLGAEEDPGEDGGDDGGDGDESETPEDGDAEAPSPGTEDPEPDVTAAPDPTPQIPEVTYDVAPRRGGYRGVARVPLRPGRALLTASSLKPTKAAAARGALKLATRALDSRAAAALVPPQARMALTVLRSPRARRLAKRAARFGVRRIRRRFGV